MNFKVEPPNNMPFTTSRIFRGSKWYLTATSKDYMPSLPELRVYESSSEKVMLRAYVGELDLPKFKRSEFIVGREVLVIQEQPEFVLKSIIRSINSLKEGKINNLLWPKFGDCNDKFEEEFKEAAPILMELSKMNEEQSLAAYSIITSAHKDAPFVLNGPAGTGKTTVIVETIQLLLKMDEEVRVLIMAGSNFAADAVALKVMKKVETASIGTDEVLRLYSMSRDFLQRDERLDPISCINEENDQFVVPNVEDFKRYRVVICTYACATHLVNLGITEGFFSHIFCDEASQAIDSEIWIALGGLATKKTSVILCGDPEQLGPVCTLDLPAPTTDTFYSILDRYMEFDEYKTKKKLYVQLKESYRCHAEILSLVSKLFYRKKLIAVQSREEICIDPKLKYPIVFVNVKSGKEGKETGGSSYANKTEVKVVMKILHQLIDKDKIDPADIGIISPYKYQTSLLNKEIKACNDKFDGIVVDSVERFQGSERKVIIITTSRTGHLGFLDQDKRINTAFTRAMDLLVVVGKGELLGKSHSWKRFINSCVCNESVIELD